eukprot:Blabericola_migrator_1__10569@NODE_5_length_29060_cov_171_088642_g4_i0_p24_GENE_NODE_5_length_29060_cov_171_088642_g4_i0NODE_5_length_29060_cov_171_088642_g4_i0_p24_ORF_typecomplete_len122_score15_24_NODE_5_length_29060_cov_171_088642_g4_i01181412179
MTLSKATKSSRWNFYETETLTDIQRFRRNLELAVPHGRPASIDEKPIMPKKRRYDKGLLDGEDSNKLILGTFAAISLMSAGSFFLWLQTSENALGLGGYNVQSDLAQPLRFSQRRRNLLYR